MMSPQFNQLSTPINQQPKLNGDNDQYKYQSNSFPIWPYAQDLSNDEKKISQQKFQQSTFPLNFPVQPDKVSLN